MNAFALINSYSAAKILLEQDEVEGLSGHSGLGSAGYANWTNLSKNHIVLSQSFPEVLRYQKSLLEFNLVDEFPWEEIKKITGVFRSHPQIVSPEVAELIEQQKHPKPFSEEHEKKQQYNSSSLTSQSLRVLKGATKNVKETGATVKAADQIWDAAWPAIKKLWEALGWF